MCICVGFGRVCQALDIGSHVSLYCGTSICSSSRVPALLALTRRADSLLAMRLLILRLSVSVKALESGSPLYAIGRPAFFFLGVYKTSFAFRIAVQQLCYVGWDWRKALYVVSQ